MRDGDEPSGGRPVTWTFVGAPADSVLRGGGAEGSPARLRVIGLPARLGAHDAGDLPIRIRGDERDPGSGIIEAEQVLANARTIREAVGARVASGERVMVAGGCCAVAPGAIAGARDALGRLGLIYVDGHQDLWDGSTSASGEAADMPLGVVIGTGPAGWIDAVGGAPVAPGDGVLVGNHDDAEARSAGLPDPSDRGLTHLPVERVRAIGPSAAGTSALASLRDAGVGPFWLHLDVDVLDAAAFPATDYPDPGGMTWDELRPLLAPIGRDADLVGLSLGCFNPDKDEDGSCGEGLVELLVGALA
jgi:arginase